MSWKGPVVDGVTQSLMNKFLQCPYCFYLYAILNLKEEQELQENLMWGDTFHIGLEHYLPDSDFALAKDKIHDKLIEYNRVRYLRSILNMLNLYDCSKHMDCNWTTEEIIDQPLEHNGTTYRFRGKRDGICREHDEYGQLLVEHKCKGYIDPPLTKYELPYDLQCNMYMYLDGTEWVAYDLIRIPDTQKYGPPQATKEDYETYISRIYSGPIGSYGGNYPIHMHTSKWINQSINFLPREDQETYWSQTIWPLVTRMNEWYEYVTSPEFEFNNPDCYNSLFYRNPIRHFDGRKTEKFKCDYYSYLTDEITLEELSPTTMFKELDV